MTNNISKISLKFNGIKIRIEGEHNSNMNDIPNILDVISAFSEKHGLSMQSSEKTEATSEGKPVANDDLSTATIAERLGAKSAPDLVIAAATRLTIFESKASFSRSQVLNEMKRATGHYKTSMGSNLSAALKSLVKGKRLNETGSGTYALTASEKQNLEKTLG